MSFEEIEILLMGGNEVDRCESRKRFSRESVHYVNSAAVDNLMSTSTTGTIYKLMTETLICS